MRSLYPIRKPFTGGGEPKSLLCGVRHRDTLVGIVILGGIKSIGRVAGLIVPVMCAMYVLASLYILWSHMPQIFRLLLERCSLMLWSRSRLWRIDRRLIQGFRRAAFSNEAGVGSASIAHSAAATNEPVREGCCCTFRALY